MSLKKVRISRLLHTSPASERQVPRAGVEECDPSVPHDSLAVVQSEWGRALDPNALNERPGDSASCGQDTAHGNTQQRFSLLNVVEDDGIRRASTTAFL